MAIDTLVFINNEISLRMAEAALRERGIGYDRVALFLTRTVRAPWIGQCAVVVDYGRKPSFSLAGQLGLIGYFRRSSSLLRRLLKSGRIKTVMLINNDNPLTNHVFAVARAHPEMEIAVLAEGIMNFQDIQLKNRDSWRTLLKPALATALGLKWREPTGHLSGAFEPETQSVYSFSSAGVYAPPEKVRVVQFAAIKPTAPPDPDAALIVMTGLHLWMTEEAYAEFSRRFMAWLATLPYKRIVVKRHPRASEGPLFAQLQDYPVVGEGVSIEDMAGDLEVGTVIGFCCTGLVTLRMLRPDIECLDFGSDFYCDAAYFGDTSVQRLLTSVGVKLVASEPYAAEAVAAA